MLPFAHAATPQLIARLASDRFSPNRDGRSDTLALTLGADPATTVYVRLIGAGGRFETAWRLPASPSLSHVVLRPKPLAQGWYRLVVEARGYPVLRLPAEAVVRPPRISIRGGAGGFQVRVRPFGQVSYEASAWLVDAAGEPLQRLSFDRRGATLALPAPDPGVSGSYRVTVDAVDALGNRGDAQSRPFTVVRPGTARVVRSNAAAGRKVALTFDDGYDQPSTLRILQELTARGAPATLFINSTNYEAHPAVVAAVRAALRRGLVTLGNHTRTHPRLPTLSAEAVREQLQSDEAYVERTFGISSAPLFRPPYGDYDATVAAVAGSLGYTDLVLWSVDPADYLGGSGPTIAARVMAELSPGGIILMHLDPSTAAALPLVIDGLRARGYEIVGLRPLLSA